LLSVDGRVLREYWHTGRLSHVASGTIAGKPVVFLGGINNARHAAMLVALDYEHWRGAAVEESPKFQLLGLPPGVELRRFVFSRSCINQAGELYNGIGNLVASTQGVTVHVQEQINASAPPILYYTFDPVLRYASFGISDVFQALHRQLARDGTLDHEWSTAEEQQQAIVYEVKDGHALPMRATQ
jgi:hypothetical protein